MSAFYKKLTESVDSTNLKRVKVTYLDGFTGYILEEDENGQALVYMVGDNSGEESQVVSLGPDEYEEIDNTDILETVKRVSLIYLITKGLIGQHEEDKIVEILNAGCIVQVDQQLRSYSLTDTEILNVLKTAFIA
jgi:hypothetical protein|tara:strand:+ start:978 stop:1382 length:405 start_codon:yes stop_codon:yes gene_type:complete